MDWKIVIFSIWTTIINSIVIFRQIQIDDVNSDIFCAWHVNLPCTLVRVTKIFNFIMRMWPVGWTNKSSSLCNLWWFPREEWTSQFLLGKISHGTKFWSNFSVGQRVCETVFKNYDISNHWISLKSLELVQNLVISLKTRLWTENW